VNERKEKGWSPYREKDPACVLHLEVLQCNEGEGCPHSDAEAKPHDQSCDVLAVHVLSLSPLIGRPEPLQRECKEPALGSWGAQKKE
jgi:hypothetical protein